MMNHKSGAVGQEAALTRSIHDAGDIGPVAGAGWIRVSRLDGGPPYAVFVAPLRIEDEQLLGDSAKVLVIVHDTGEHHAADSGMLVSIYGLTEAEARLASALTAGHSIESAAAKLGVREATARSQLKSIL